MKLTIAKMKLPWMFLFLFAWTPAFGAVVDVSIQNFLFNPMNVTVNVGDTVRWTNNGTTFHTSTSTVAPGSCLEGGSDPWDSDYLAPGEVFQRTFNIPGTYPYKCIPHCAPPMNMRGTVTVIGPDFSLSCNPILVSGLPGDIATGTCTVSSIMGFSNSVDLSCAGLPTGATCGFVPDPVTPPANGDIDSMLTVTIDSAIPTGTYDFQVTGSGPNFSRSFAMVLAVSDFTVSSSPSSLIAQPGGNASSTTTVTSVQSFNGAVDLACMGLPIGATCNFSPSTVTPPPNGSIDSALTVTVGGGVAEGNYPFQISGTSSGQSRVFDMTLTVTTAQDFSISCNPTSIEVPLGGSGTSLCTITSINSYNASVSFTCSNLPANVTCSFNPNPVTPPANGTAQSTLTINVGPNAVFGTYIIQVDATDGTLSHSAGITLHVAPLFIDDFEDGDASDWTFLKGNWSVISGDLVGTYDRKATALAPFIMPINATIEADIEPGFEVGGRITLIGWQVNKKNTVDLILNEFANKVVLKHKVNGQTILKTKGIHPIIPNMNHHVQITYTGTAFIVSIDGTQVISINGQAPFSGTPGFKVKGTTGTFGKIVVY